MATFMFLQGNATPFFSALGFCLRQLGHRMTRINLNMGDRCFWPMRPARDYTGDLRDWPAWLARALDREHIDAILLFGRWRPHHVAATALARTRGIRTWNFDEAYLRPGYVTMERIVPDGLACLPATADALLARAAGLRAPPPQACPPGRFFERAGYDVAYHALRALGQWRFPQYRFHSLNDPFREYVAFLGSVGRAPQHRARAASVWRAIAQAPGYYLYPLQVEGDFQIRARSRFKGNAQALGEVIASFAAHAPAGTLLVVKAHPLDPGLADWPATVASLAARHGVGDRVHVIHSPALDALVAGATGVVTINSTVGMAALAHQRPVIALGQAVYNIPGLTHARPLDSFWREAEAPAPELFASLKIILVSQYLIEGDFFSAHGRRMAVRNAVARLTGGKEENNVIF